MKQDIKTPIPTRKIIATLEWKEKALIKELVEYTADGGKGEVGGWARGGGGWLVREG